MDAKHVCREALRKNPLPVGVTDALQRTRYSPHREATISLFTQRVVQYPI